MAKVKSGLLLAALSAVSAGMAALEQPFPPAMLGQEVRPGVLTGYQPKGAEPDRLAIVPPAAAKDSATQARDEALNSAPIVQS
jgi:hypothetical protein